MVWVPIAVEGRDNISILKTVFFVASLDRSKVRISEASGLK